MKRSTAFPNGRFPLPRSLRVPCLACILALAFAAPLKADWVTVEPDPLITYYNTCLPFGIGDPDAAYVWYPYTVYVYENVPPFSLAPGGILAFDQTVENDFDIGLAISMAPASANGGTHNASPFVQVVSNTQNPGRGDTVPGNFDLEFTAEGAFDFPGGGLLIRFSDPSAAYQMDDTCTQGTTSTAGWRDLTDNFLTRYISDADGLPPWPLPANSNILAFRVDSTTLEYEIQKTALDITGTETAHSSVGDTVTYRIVFTNNDDVGITDLEITDTLPADVDYIDASAAVTYDAGPPATVVWSPGSVAAGESVSLDIDVQILGSADGKTLVNQAEVTDIGAPHTPGLSSFASVLVAETAADLEVSATVTDPYSLLFDLNVYFNFTIQNHGPDTATDVQFISYFSTDPYYDFFDPFGDPEVEWYIVWPLPEGVKSCTIDTGLYAAICELEDLDPGASVVIRELFEMFGSGGDIDFTYDAMVGSGSFDQASYEVPDPVPENNRITRTVSVVRAGEGSGGCSTAGPEPGQPFWPGLLGIAAVLLVLFRMRCREKRRQGQDTIP